MDPKDFVFTASFALRLVAVGWAGVILYRLRTREAVALTLLTVIAAAVQPAMGGALRDGIKVYVFTFPFTISLLCAVWFVGRTLTQRRQTFDRLRHTEAELRTTLENVSDGVFTTTPSGEIDYSSPKAASLFGLPPQRLQGMHVGSLLGDAFPPTSGTLRNWPHTFATAEGSRTALIDAKPIVGGPSDRTLYVCRDVTEQVDAQSALKEALVQVSQLQDRLRAENTYLRMEVQHQAFEDIVGRSEALAVALRKVEQVADTDATVLITGETGVGKELFARAIHAVSRRKDRPLVRVNCSTLPPSLIESELFGHERGAFTGATARRAGRFQLAHEGTILLDEIGDLPLELQPKLLRVLQDGEFQRLGGSETVRVDVRVIAATNHDLAADVAAKRFRADLFFRLNVFPIQVPPLRDRVEDIPDLVHFLLERCGRSLHRTFSGITTGSMDRLRAYRWPGNIRELENVIERAAIAASGPVVRIGQLDEPVDATPSNAVTLEEVERAYILQVLEQTQWVIEGAEGAAAVLGMHPSTLRSRLKKLRIARPAVPS